jgi:hypothetical protein
MNSKAATDFYKADATEVYAESFDFTVVESAAPMPNATRNKLLAAISRKLATAVVAVATGIVTIPMGGAYPFGISVTSTVVQEVSHASDIIAITNLMRERAELAKRVFQRTPHTGNDDVEPDYGF